MNEWMDGLKHHLGQIDKVGQHSRVMNVQVSLQLISDGLAEQLHAVVGSLCILLIANRGAAVASRAVWRAGAAACTAHTVQEERDQFPP